MESQVRTHHLTAWMSVAAAILLAPGYCIQMNANQPRERMKKILFVLTSHDKIEKTGEPTGFFFSEVSHPWEVLVNAGYEIDFVSPKGGKAPVDGFDLSDPINRKFWDDPNYRQKVENTKSSSEVDPDDYVAIHFAGGHGAMWDLADDVALAVIAASIYQGGGVVSAVCHGPAGLVNIKLPGGKFLVDGKRVNAFTNEEEAAAQLADAVPFLLESKLIEHGAVFEKSAPWQPHVVADQRLVTGQNPQSAKAVGDAVLEQLRHLEVIGKLTRYEVSAANRESFRKALTEYTDEAMGGEGNIMAESYQEQEKPRSFWLIERWQNRNALDQFAHHPSAKEIEVLKADEPGTAAETYFIKDLAPLSKKEWRVAPRAEDQPLTVMLFVDSKPGTQDHFMATYHTALPPFRSQPGVIAYQLSRIEGEVTKFVTYEKFRSPEAFQAHLNFPPIKPVLGYLETSIRKQPFQAGLRLLVELTTPE